MDRCFVLHTLLMWIYKAQSWALTDRLRGATLADILFEETQPAIPATARRDTIGVTVAANARLADCAQWNMGVGRRKNDGRL